MSPVVVVDTNVPITANGAEDVDADCVLACQRAVQEVLEDRRALVIDDDFEIIAEYQRNLLANGSPRVGDTFLKWVLTNWTNPARCQQVAITPVPPEEGGFAEFPNAKGLETFDPSDRKFVAVANAHPERPPILQALDSKWWGWRQALASVGVTVEFLCREQIQATYERKFGTPAKPRRRKRRG